MRSLAFRTREACELQLNSSPRRRSELKSFYWLLDIGAPFWKGYSVTRKCLFGFTWLIKWRLVVLGAVILGRHNCELNDKTPYYPYINLGWSDPFRESFLMLYCLWPLLVFLVHGDIWLFLLPQCVDVATSWHHLYIIVMDY